MSSMTDPPPTDPGDWQIDGGAFTNVKFGLRWAEHERETHQVAQGPNFAGADPFANLPNWDGSTYPDDFADDLGGNFPRNVWQLSPEELERWGDIYSNRDPVSRRFWSGEFRIEEENTAIRLYDNKQIDFITRLAVETKKLQGRPDFITWPEARANAHFG